MVGVAVGMGELDLDAGADDVVVRQRPGHTVDLEVRGGLPGGDDPSGDGGAVGEHRADEPAAVALPVAGHPQRPLHAGRADLQHVGLVAQQRGALGVVQCRGELGRQLGTVLEGHPAGTVDEQDHAPAAPGPRHLEGLDVQAAAPGEGLDERRESLLDSCAGASGRRAHGGILAV